MRIIIDYPRRSGYGQTGLIITIVTGKRRRTPSVAVCGDPSAPSFKPSSRVTRSGVKSRKVAGRRRSVLNKIFSTRKRRASSSYAVGEPPWLGTNNVRCTCPYARVIQIAYFVPFCDRLTNGRISNFHIVFHARRRAATKKTASIVQRLFDFVSNVYDYTCITAHLAR